MKYGYARVSTKDQHEDRQIENLLKNGVEQENIFIDKISGKNFNRPEYQNLVAKLQEGDVLYIHSIDRLGRNYDMILEEWNRITKTIKADIVVLDMPLLDTTQDRSNLTGKFMADLVLQILSYVAEVERNKIRERSREGIEIAKAKGVYDKVKIDMNRLAEVKKEVDAGRMSVAAAAREFGISRLSIYRRFKKLEDQKNGH